MPVPPSFPYTTNSSLLPTRKAGDRDKTAPTAASISSQSLSHHIMISPSIILSSSSSSSSSSHHRSTPSTDSQGCHVCDALKLVPQHPIERARRIKRPVRARDGMVHHRSVLVTMDSPSHPRAYSLKGIIFEQNKKGVTIYHATPVKPITTSPPPTPNNHISEDDLLVSSGPSVVIKVIQGERVAHNLATCKTQPHHHY